MRVAAVAAVVAAAAGVAAAATECSSILPFAASCDIEDGLLIVSPDPGSILAANCRGYCTASPVSIRLRPCAFCTAERCQTGYDVRGHPMVCCDEDACTAACEKPPENCRYGERDNVMGAGRGGGMDRCGVTGSLIACVKERGRPWCPIVTEGR